MSELLSQIKKESELAVEELLAAAKLKKGDILVVGCSSSEIIGERIGTHSSFETAEAVLEGILPVLKMQGIYIAAQCCEHLNRAIVLEAAVAQRERLAIVNVVPQIKAGGSFGTAVYAKLEEPACVEKITAQAGLDIGNTLIGMHLAEVAVPVRLGIRKIGEANLVAARTRPKFIGGNRAVYDENLL